MERVSKRERDYVEEVLQSQFRTSAGGKMTRRLEEAFARTFGVRYAVSLCNGTATLHTALLAAGVGQGDEVIVPPLTMASTSFAVIQAGARPVFADIDPETLTIDPKDIERKITPRTKAVIPVAIYGLPHDVDAVMGIAERHKLVVIEDDAQCFLGRYKGRILGGTGHMASFSFQASKHITCGEGGIVITDDEAYADSIRRMSNLGYFAVSGKPGKGKISKDEIQHPSYQRHAAVGWNYRMSELCAAVALGQVERLEELVATRREIAAMYAVAAEGCRWLVPQRIPQGYEHSYWTYVVRLENGGAFSWADFRRKYMELGGDGIYGAWQLTYLEPPFKAMGYAPGLCPVAESVQPKLLQFKTNYMDMSVAQRKADALAQTIKYFGEG